MPHKLLRQVQTFLADEEGPTLVEYAVMLMAIILVLITAIQIIGQSTNSTFDTIAKTFGS